MHHLRPPFKNSDVIKEQTTLFPLVFPEFSVFSQKLERFFSLRWSDFGMNFEDLSLSHLLGTVLLVCVFVCKESYKQRGINQTLNQCLQMIYRFHHLFRYLLRKLYNYWQRNRFNTAAVNAIDTIPHTTFWKSCKHQL